MVVSRLADVMIAFPFINPGDRIVAIVVPASRAFLIGADRSRALTRGWRARGWLGGESCRAALHYCLRPRSATSKTAGGSSSTVCPTCRGPSSSNSPSTCRHLIPGWPSLSYHRLRRCSRRPPSSGTYHRRRPMVNLLTAWWIANGLPCLVLVLLGSGVRADRRGGLSEPRPRPGALSLLEIDYTRCGSSFPRRVGGQLVAVNGGRPRVERGDVLGLVCASWPPARASPAAP